MLWCWVLELIQSSRSVCNDWKIVEKPFVNKNASFSCMFRCIERLRDLHIASGNFTEAGYTVLEHAKLLEVLLLLIFNFFCKFIRKLSPNVTLWNGRHTRSSWLFLIRIWIKPNRAWLKFSITHHLRKPKESFFSFVHQWSDLPVNDPPDSMTQFQLKEKLYLDAISFLDKGKVS